MNIKDLEQTCGGCPTVFEWKNNKEHSIYFHLRNGYARIINETKNKTIIQGTFPYGDGVCSWAEVVKWADENQLHLNVV